jgi:hypothetical protein
VQDSLPAGGLRLYREGVEPSGSLRKVSGYISILLSRTSPVARVVYAKRPFAGPEQVLEYVGRYTHRVAISNNRILDIEDGKVRFQWKDYRCGGQQKPMILNAEEFTRRFLMHVLPRGFQRIRYYGLLGNRYRKDKLARCRELIGMSKLEPLADQANKDYRDTYQELTGISLCQCPVCHLGRMVLFRALRPITSVPAIIDTS